MTAPMDDLPVMVTDAGLGSVAGVRHGFFGRQGGVSSGLYASLNCGPGSGDARDNVRINRDRVARSLGFEGDRLLTLYQIHSADTVTVSAPWTLETPPRADGLVTDRPGLTLGILTADCCPVLFADRQAGVIGAAHAGWKGALAGVTEATIEAMITLGAERDRITGAIGPTIRQANYEVGPEFPDPFLKKDPSAERFFVPGQRSGHWQFDLPGYIEALLRTAGLQQIGDCGASTYGDPARYFSFRRTTHLAEADYGRNISVIALDDTGS